MASVTHRVCLGACAVLALNLGGCANLYMVDPVEKGYLPSESPTMAAALKYSDRIKTNIVKTAGTPFNIGQGLNGVFIAAAGAATSLLAFDGNTAAAAGVGLGAGALGLTDRFLLVDESLAIYKNAVEALNCAESLLVPLASDPSRSAFALKAAMINSAMPGSLTEFSVQNRAYVDSTAYPAPARVASAAVEPSLTAAGAAADNLLVALQAASDGGASVGLTSPRLATPAAASSPSASDSAAKRLVLFADQARSTVNVTIMQKRATTEELAGAFKTIVGDYVKALDDQKKAAKQKVAEAKAAQEAALLSTGEETARTRLSLASAQLKNSELVIDAIAANVPDETKIQACLVKVAGGAGSGNGGS